MLRRTLIAGLACLAGCSSVLGIGDLEGPVDATPPPSDAERVPLPACRAQRVVHLVGGNGSLSWYTLLWPVPAVINSFTPTFAYDDPARAADVTVVQGHQLFARRRGAQALWQGRGTHPQPTAIIAGVNETHTNQPQSAITSNGIGLVPAGATIQVAQLQPPVAALVLGVAPYGTAPGAPSSIQAADVDAAISALAGTIPPGVDLRPTATQLAAYVPANAPTAVTTLANRLAFTANLMKRGLVGSVVIPGFNDDPHNAFTDLAALAIRVDQLGQMLDAFYADLATVNEAGCGDSDGDPLAMSDNVVMIVTGDTPKNPFDNAGWADGTPNNSNVMYLRSNGFIKPGWFGQLTPGVRTTFDPVTGNATGGATAAENTASAWAAALYAISRGNKLAVMPFSTAPFDGLIATP